MAHGAPPRVAPTVAHPKSPTFSALSAEEKGARIDRAVQTGRMSAATAAKARAFWGLPGLVSTPAAIHGRQESAAIRAANPQQHGFKLTAAAIAHAADVSTLGMSISPTDPEGGYSALKAGSLSRLSKSVGGKALYNTTYEHGPLGPITHPGASTAELGMIGIPFLRGGAGLRGGIRAAREGEPIVRGAIDAFKSSTPILTAAGGTARGVKKTARVAFGKTDLGHIKTYHIGGAEVPIPAAGARSSRLVERLVEKAKSQGMLQKRAAQEVNRQARTTGARQGVHIELLQRALKKLNPGEHQALRIIMEQDTPQNRLAFHEAQAAGHAAAGDEVGALYHNIHAANTIEAAKHVEPGREAYGSVFSAGASPRVRKAYDALVQSGMTREQSLEAIGKLNNDAAVGRIFGPVRVTHGARYVDDEKHIESTLAASPGRQALVADFQRRFPDSWQHHMTLEDAKARHVAELSGDPMNVGLYYDGLAVHSHPTQFVPPETFHDLPDFLAQTNEHLTPEARNAAIDSIWEKAQAARAASKSTGHRAPVPHQLTSRDEVAKLFDQLHSQALEGIVARHWYTASGKAILAATGGDKEQARIIARLVALTSPQQTVYSNTRSAIQLWNAWKTKGEAGFRAEVAKLSGKEGEIADKMGVEGLITRKQVTQAIDILKGKTPNEADYLGQKTHSFYKNFLQEFDPSHFRKEYPGEDPKIGPVTFDTWMRRALHFERKPKPIGPGKGDSKIIPHTKKLTARQKSRLTDEQIAEHASGKDIVMTKWDEPVSPDAYDFGSHTVAAVANALGWKPHEAQAAIWTSVKKAWEGENFAGGGQFHIGDALKRLDGEGLHALFQSISGRSGLEMAQKVGRDLPYEVYTPRVQTAIKAAEKNIADRTAEMDKLSQSGQDMRGSWQERSLEDAKSELASLRQQVNPREDAAIRGAYVPSEAAVHLAESAGSDTAVHEMAHHLRSIMPQADQNKLGAAMGATWNKDTKSYIWDRASEEKFANSVLAVLRSGEEPPGVPGLRAAFHAIAKDLRDSHYLWNLPDLDPVHAEAIRNLFKFAKVDGGRIRGAEDIIGQTSLEPIYAAYTRGAPIRTGRGAAVSAFIRNAGVFGRGAIKEGPHDPSLENAFKASLLLDGFFRSDMRGNVKAAQVASKLTISHQYRPLLLAAAEDLPTSKYDVPIYVDPSKAQHAGVSTSSEIKRVQTLLDSLDSDLTSHDLEGISLDLARTFQEAMYPAQINGRDAHLVAGELLGEGATGIDNVKWVPADFLHKSILRDPALATRQAKRGFEKVAANVGSYALDSVVDIGRLTTIILSPSYVPINLLQNVGMLASTQGWHLPANLYRAALMHRTFSKLERMQIDRIMGHGAMSQAFLTQVLLRRPSHILGHAYGLAVDLVPRRAAFLHAAGAAGLDGEGIKRLLRGEDDASLNVIRQRAVDSIGDFDRMGNFEKNVLTRIIFIYPWLKASTRWTQRFVVDHPVQAVGLALMADYAITAANQNQGKLGSDRPWSTQGQIPASTDALGVNVPGVGGVGLKDLGIHAGNPKQVVDLKTLFTQTQPAELAQSIGGFAMGSNDFSSLTELLQPPWRDALTAMTGYDTFRGKTVPRGPHTFFNQLLDFPLRQKIDALRQSPDQRVAANARKINPTSSTEDWLRVFGANLIPKGYSEANAQGVVARSKGGGALQTFNLHQLAATAGWKIPPEVQKEFDWHVKLTEAIHGKKTYVDKLTALGGVLQQRFGKRPAFLDNVKTMPESEAHDAYLQIVAQFTPDLRDWTSQAQAAAKAKAAAKEPASP